MIEPPLRAACKDIARAVAKCIADDRRPPSETRGGSVTWKHEKKTGKLRSSLATMPEADTKTERALAQRADCALHEF
jgi:hypothetical protein